MIFAVRSSAAKYFYRFWFLVPVVVPLIVILLLWRFIYDPNVGLLNALLDALGLPGIKRAWLGDLNIALFALMFLGFPFISGTNVLIYLAGLVNIPKEVMESAELDGVTTLGRIFRIDIPLLAGQIKLFLVLGTISASL
jgi:ABC-type sugar transport system permease subunit